MENRNGTRGHYSSQMRQWVDHARQSPSAPVRVSLEATAAATGSELVFQSGDTLATRTDVCWDCLQRRINCDCEVFLTPAVLNRREFGG